MRRFAVVLLLLAPGIGRPHTSAARAEEIAGPFLTYSPSPPGYPSDWRVRAFEGAVLVRVMVDTSGSVTADSVITSGYADTDSAAARFARACRFEPYRYYRTGRPEPRAIHLPVRFRHPTSENLVPAGQELTSAQGMLYDSTGRAERLVVRLRSEVVLDSVTGSYQYRYELKNEPTSRTKTFYFALYPISPSNGNAALPVVEGRGNPPRRLWSTFRGCGGHIDVFGWMAAGGESGPEPKSSGIAPGEGLQGFSFDSPNPPENGHWIAGGGSGCGPACFPWADTCSLVRSITGTTCLPGWGGYAHGSLSGEIVGERLAPIPGARVAILGAGRDTIAAANGSYFIADVPPGRFRVRVSAPGCTPSERWVDFGYTTAWCNLRLSLATPADTLRRDHTHQ